MAAPLTIKSGFDWLAPHYRWMECVLAGPKLQRCRTAFLHSIPAPCNALLLGEGNGRFLIELIRVFPNARFTCVDASARMLDRARARLRARGLDVAAGQFLRANILDWAPPSAQFDLIVSHFFLDCFRPAELEQLIPRLSSAAVPGARWLLADFRQPPSGPAKWRARAILESMYLFFRVAAGLSAARLTPPDALLERHGFTLRDRRLFEWGLLHSDLWIARGN